VLNVKAINGLDKYRLQVAFVLVCICSFCGEERHEAMTRGFGPSSAGGRAKPAPRQAAAPEAAPEAGQAQQGKVTPLQFTDDDVIESEKNRDPFRSYFALFKVARPSVVQRQVIMPTTSIEEMTLIAIISGVPRPKAMLLDPRGIGHVVERGMFLGRPQIVQASENVSMTLNWRVHRIRENELVLIREDPTDPTRPALTRVIPLREEEELRLKPI
jgi:type IV pilus assembly protein PilP